MMRRAGRDNRTPDSASPKTPRCKVCVSKFWSTLGRAIAHWRARLVHWLARISHSKMRIGAPNQRKLLCENDFQTIRRAPRCQQSVARIYSDLHQSKDEKLLLGLAGGGGRR